MPLDGHRWPGYLRVVVPGHERSDVTTWPLLVAAAITLATSAHSSSAVAQEVSEDPSAVEAQADATRGQDGWAEDPPETPTEPEPEAAADGASHGTQTDDAVEQRARRRRAIAQLRARRERRVAAQEETPEEAYARFTELSMGGPITLMAVSGGVFLVASLLAIFAAVRIGQCNDEGGDDCVSPAIKYFVVDGLAAVGFSASAMWVASRNSERRALRQKHLRYFRYRRRNPQAAHTSGTVRVVAVHNGLGVRVDI